MKKRLPRDPSTRHLVWWSAAMLIPAAHYLETVLHLDYLLPGVLLLLFWSWLPRSGRAASDRAVIYSFVAALALTAFGNDLAAAERGAAGFSFFFLRVRVMGPLTLFCAALAAGFRRREHLLGLSALALFFAFGAGFDCRMPGGAEQPWMLFGIPLSFRHFYGGHAILAVTAFLGATLWYDRPFSGRSALRLSAALAAVLLLTAGSLPLQSRFDGFLRRISSRFLGMDWEGAGWFSGHSVPEMPHLSGDLHAPFPAETPEERSEALFYVKGKNPPRYWRIAAFTWYRRGSWISRKNASGGKSKRELEIDPAALSKRTLRADQPYLLRDLPAERLRPCDLYYANWKGEGPLPVPGSAARLNVAADRVEQCEDGTLTLHGTVKEAGCTLFCDPAASEAGQSPPLGENAEFLFYLDVPPRLRQTLDLHLLLAGVSPESDDAENASLLVRYLQTNYAYAADWPRIPFYRDPVDVFLSERRRGHCELFAASLTLLLRQAGIPARYVAGLLCHETDGDDQHFVMRRRHLHAWVEAFDRDRGEWVLLDPTPGVAEELDLEPAAGNTLASRWRHFRLNFLTQLRRGHWIGGIAGWFYDLAEAGERSWRTWIGLPVLSAVLLLLLRLLKKRRAGRSSRAGVTRELERFCRSFVKRGLLGKEATGQTTAAEILQRLRETHALSAAEEAEAEKFIRHYLIRRFGKEKGVS